MPSYTVSEPHPTVPQGSYTRAGRGGAGNFFRAPATTPAAGVPTVAKPMPPSTERFYSGRGGAGNARSAKDRPQLSFDELYKIQSLAEEKPAGHVGRGGAGNVYGSGSLRKESDASSHRSNSSSGSIKSGFLKRLSSVSSKGPM
ncbi:hypothetical protein JX265_006756 [Neoarthrinium moseri]|uniref:Uncharacterized protein n=1 Tax=Neoarthrinium moseri TaxID=1658444 RepID=A0A9Q0AQA4_9PEZI|nr:uncharacterized protein JN550_002772 [Neoarthrinium moseri]KAI1847051.1 hypothetical protein JX266_006926 [Neoarthrinium moseri]KAI1868777.1 hypothetical protein JX265_006756 [Neoarthrinium moseri]KAI1874193.1 hypothetical protein JN550_002772 [Neoarthrinium moseri]